MMTKWDTIQADVSDAYVYLDEEEAYNKALEEGNISLLDVNDFDEDELGKALTLDWND
jgi:hypothetical protein